MSTATRTNPCAAVELIHHLDRHVIAYFHARTLAGAEAGLLGMENARGAVIPERPDRLFQAEGRRMQARADILRIGRQLARWLAAGKHDPAGVLAVVDDVEWGGRRLAELWPPVRVALQTLALREEAAVRNPSDEYAAVRAAADHVGFTEVNGNPFFAVAFAVRRLAAEVNGDESRPSGPAAAALLAPAAASAGGVKGKRINELMLARMKSNPDAALKMTLRDWALELKCAASTVGGTDAWQKLQQLREGARIARELNKDRRARNNKPSARS